MKRFITITLISAAALALFGALVYGVLVMANVSAPAATTVHGLTLRRAWATASAGVALVSAISGGLALARPGAWLRGHRRQRGFVALGGGCLAAMSGALNVAMSRGGPGTGNGVVGGAAALILGLLAVTLGVRALTRTGHRRMASRASFARESR
jgi:hypothetical protein